jgi:hypothetical protein
MKYYKTSWACMDCRLAMKDHDTDGYVKKCTSCLKPMCMMGRDFHVPRRSNKKQWEKLRILTRNGTVDGVFATGCGCGGPGYIPRTLADAKADVRNAQERALKEEKAVPKFYHEGWNVKWNT